MFFSALFVDPILDASQQARAGVAAGIAFQNRLFGRNFTFRAATQDFAAFRAEFRARIIPARRAGINSARPRLKSAAAIPAKPVRLVPAPPRAKFRESSRQFCKISGKIAENFATFSQNFGEISELHGAAEFEACGQWDTPRAPFHLWGNFSCAPLVNSGAPGERAKFDARRNFPARNGSLQRPPQRSEVVAIALNHSATGAPRRRRCRNRLPFSSFRKELHFSSPARLHHP